MEAKRGSTKIRVNRNHKKTCIKNNDMNIIRQLFGRGTPINLKTIINEGAFLVDVRTAGEFAEGHVKGSVNIPLTNIATQLEKFRNKKNIVVFCRSGARSSQAKAILEQNGITNVVNGGSWMDVNHYV